MKRILVSGSRHWKHSDAKIIQNVLDVCSVKYEELHIIHGACQGVDSLAHGYAITREWIVTAVPAKWSKYGNRAGPVRNEYMLEKGRPDLVIAFHDNISQSKGTGHMVSIAKKANVPVIVISNLTDAQGVEEKLP
jgi:hypothetical protein